MSKKKAIKSALIYTILPKLPIILNLLFLPILSPFLTLSDYGIQGLVLAYVNVFQMLIFVGQNIYIQNSYFEYKNKYFLIWQRCFGLMTICGLMASVILGSIIYFFLSATIGVYWPIVVICSGLFLILSPINEIVVSYCVLKEQPLLLALSSLLGGLLSVLISFVCIKYFKLGYLGWVLAMPINGLFLYIFYFKKIIVERKIYPRLKLTKRFLKRALGIGLPLVPHQMSLYIMNASDRVLLPFFGVGIKSIGYYSQGYNMGSNGTILYNGVFQSLSKNLQEAFRSNEEYQKLYIKKIISILPLGLSICFFIGSLWCKEGFNILFRNEELRQSYPIAIIILGSLMFYPIYSFFTYPLSIQNKTFSVSKISLIAAIFNISANVVLIPHYGIWAAAGTTYASAIIFGFLGLLNKENRLFLNQYLDITQFCALMFIANISLFTISYLFKDASMYMKGPFTLLIMALYLFFVNKKLKLKR